MEIINTDHCKLCDNLHIDFAKGTFCSLTMKRPEFNKTCSKIDLNKNYEKQIEDINIEYESVIRSKSETYTNIFFYILASVLIFGLTYILTLAFYDRGYVTTLTISLAALGFIPLGKVVAIIGNYRTNLKIAKTKKEKLDTLTSLYNHSYDININPLKDDLGNIEHEVTLNVSKK